MDLDREVDNTNAIKRKYHLEFWEASFAYSFGRSYGEGFAESFERGFAEGRANGTTQVKAIMVEAFLRLARERFQDVSPERQAQLRSASLEQLETWLGRLIGAPDLESVFCESSVPVIQRLQS